jgi:hypothetical protein
VDGSCEYVNRQRQAENGWSSVLGIEHGA